MKQIFLSFAITGLDRQQVKELADRAEQLAIEMGYLPINPLTIVPSSLSNDKYDFNAWEKAMTILATHLYRAKAIMIINNEAKSQSLGALIEESTAKIRQYDIYYTDPQATKIEKHIKGIWYKNQDDDQRSHSAKLLAV